MLELFSFNLISSENMFLIFVGLIWIFFAVFQDLKKREVDNIVNFSLIAVVLAYRLIVSIYINNLSFFINGILGLLIFLALGNIFYYARLFAGGDAKLLIALGTILPLSFNWIDNFKIFGIFILGFLITGSLYVFIWASVLVSQNFKNFKKEFKLQFKMYKRIFYFAMLITLLLVFISFLINQYFFILIGILFFIFPFLFVFAKSVEESCMVKSVSPKNLTEGDWLYENLFISGKKIKSNWEGLSIDEVRFIQKKSRRNILIKQGVPFTPSFLFAFIIVILFGIKGFF